jgi:hypothetical protein
LPRSLNRRHCASPTAAALRAGLLCLGAFVLCAVGGCSRAPDAGQKAPPSPRETVAQLAKARDNRQYQVMRGLIVPERAQEVISTLTGVDDFLAANEQLCDLVRAQIGVGVADAIDQSQLAYYLDIFSHGVSLLDESIDGDTAQVSFLVDERLPARHAQLRLVAGRWRYDPGEGEFAQLSAAFERMAYGLRQVLDGLHRGQLSAERFRQNPDELINEVRIRLLPGVKLLPQGPGG